MVNLKFETIGQRLKYVRNMLGMTQSEFSDIIGMERSQIARAERGQRELKFNHLEKITKECGVNLNWLISEQGAILENIKHNPLEISEEPEIIENTANQKPDFTQSDNETNNALGAQLINSSEIEAPLNLEMMLKVVLSVETVCQESNFVLNPQAKTTAIALLYQRWLERPLEKSEIATILKPLV